MERKLSVEQIFREAFARWKSVMKYNILFSVLYLGLISIITYGVANYTGAWEKFQGLQPTKNLEVYMSRMEALMKTQEITNFSLFIPFAIGLVYPLQIGFFQIFEKKDRDEETSLNDLFAGFIGGNFVKFSLYYILWTMIYTFMQSLIVPAPFWVAITLFAPPLMFFRKEGLGNALIISFNTFKKNFALLIICVLLTAIVVYAGAFAFFVGYLFTFPFWLAMIYTLYRNIFKDETK